MLVEVIGAACNAMQEQLGSQIAEVHEAIGDACDRLDVIEGDVSAVRRQLARVLRERENDRENLAVVTKRVRQIERRGAGEGGR